MKFVHNCVLFLSYFLCIFFFVICNTYLIQIVLIDVINGWYSIVWNVMKLMSWYMKMRQTEFKEFENCVGNNN